MSFPCFFHDSLFHDVGKPGAPFFHPIQGAIFQPAPSRQLLTISMDFFISGFFFSVQVGRECRRHFSTFLPREINGGPTSSAVKI